MQKPKFPFFESINDWHLALKTGLTGLHDDFHIFRYEDVMTELVQETPYYRDAFFHLAFATSMDATLTINDKKYDCQSGGLFFFIAPEQVIHWTRGNKDWSGYLMLIKPKFMSYSMYGSQLLRDLNVFRNEGISVLQVEQNGDFTEVFEKILLEYQSEKPLKFEMIRAYLKILLVLTYRLSNSNIDRTGTNGRDELVYNFQALVDKYFREKKAVYSYAKELNIHENYLNQIVKTKTGRTASSLIKERILLEAKCLLLYTEFDIAEIAYELRFDEPSNFMRFFKTYEKVTPTEFRKRSRDTI